MLLAFVALLGGYVGYAQGRHLAQRQLRADVVRLEEEIDTREKAETTLMQLMADLEGEVSLAKMMVANSRRPHQRRRTA